MGSQHGKQTNAINVLPNIPWSKGNQTMKYGQLTKCKAAFTLIYILANSAITNCVQVKINCSKFIIDGLQQRYHMTLLETFCLLYFCYEKLLQSYKK